MTATELELAKKELINKSAATESSDSQKQTKKELYLQKYSNGIILAEAVLIARKPYFLVSDSKGHITIRETLELEDQIIKPLEASMYMNLPYSFGLTHEVDSFIAKVREETKKTLYDKGETIAKKYVDADPVHISICVADTIFTYSQDLVGSTHYLFFVGNNGSGKSNNLRPFQRLAYRNMMSTDITPANIYRFLGADVEGQGTLCEDEADSIDLDSEKMRIYKNGYTANVKVMRSDSTNYGTKTQAFYTYCWKAFAAERLPDSLKAKGFNERCIEIQCTPGFPEYDITEVTSPAGVEVFQALLNELNDYRNTLLIYRLLHYHEPIPRAKLNIEGRESQLFSPLIRVFKDSEVLAKLLPVISKYISQKREKNANSLHAFLYKTIKQLIQAQQTIELESSLIWETIKNTLQGQEPHNKPHLTVEYGTISQKEIVQILKEVFGANKSRKHGEGRTLVFEQKKLERLGRIYDLEVEVQVVEGNVSHGTLVPHIPLYWKGVGDVEPDKKIEQSSPKEPAADKKPTIEQSTNDVEPLENASHVEQVAHAALNDGSIQCPKCGVYTTQSGLEQHIRITHQESQLNTTPEPNEGNLTK